MPPVPKFQKWPSQHPAFESPGDIQRAYDSGWQGCIPNPKAKERFRDVVRETSGYQSFADAAHDNRFAGSGKGKLVLGFRAVEAIWKYAYPGGAQQCGCCVSMSTRNALLMTFACQHFSNKSREPHGLPEVPDDGQRNCVFSNAPIYWFRGSNGDGWDCPTAAAVACKYVGLVPCRDWGDGVDLTHCTRDNDHMYGAQRPPHELIEKFGDHRAASAAEITSLEELADALANGFGVSTCGGEGFSGHRNEDGLMERSGSWSHAMHENGIDWRDSTIAKYKEPLILYEQSWGMWGSGPREIRGTDMEIPNGFFWVRWSAVKNRWRCCFSGTKSWKPSPLEDYGGTEAYN